MTYLYVLKTISSKSNKQSISVKLNYNQHEVIINDKCIVLKPENEISDY